MSLTVKLWLTFIMMVLLTGLYVVSVGPLARDHHGSRAYHGADWSNIQGSNSNVIYVCDREPDGFNAKGIMEINGDRAVAVTNGYGDCESTHKSKRYSLHYTMEDGRQGTSSISRH